MKTKKVDTVFLGLIITLLTVGIFMFISASLGILARNETEFYRVLFDQLVLGLGGGLLALIAALRIPYKFWRDYAFFIFLGSIILTALVFVPHLGFSHGGARRWISVLGVSFQPVEFLKLGFVMYFAAWLSWLKTKSADPKWGVIPLVILFSTIAFVLFRQPDTKSFILIIIAGLSMFLISGVPWKYIIGLAVLAGVVLTVLVFFKPYLVSRVTTFLNPAHDVSGSSYQLNQSLIAIGSGGVAGRGYGQSIQKFSYLPEPQGDSIFAVIGEEFGFIGTTILVLLFTAFALRGLRIASHAPDLFSRLVVVGIVILFVFQSFLNITSLVGLFPLTGVPLVFISQGGTSLMISLFAIGIVLNISAHQHKKA